MSHPAHDLVTRYREQIASRLADLEERNATALETVAQWLADQISQDRLVHVYGPGGHSNLASQEVFFRAGGLMHMSAILDEGTLMSSGALRSMAVERTPGYGRIVMDQMRLGPDDLLILVNAYGINSTLIDSALAARERGVKLIGISSRQHADSIPPDHPARHPSKANLHDVVDLHLDSDVPVGDAIMTVGTVTQNVGPVSTFANAFLLNSLVLLTVAELAARGIDPPIWRSGNSPGGDQANAQHTPRFVGRVKWL